MTEEKIRQNLVNHAAGYIGNLVGMTDEMQAQVDLYNSKRSEENARWGTRTTKMIMSDKSGWGWCAMFVSNMGIETGYDTVVPVEIGVYEYMKIAKNYGIWQNSSYVPSPADIVIYDWSSTTNPYDHVEIVEYVDGMNLHTIGGNNGGTPGQVSRRTIQLNDSQIVGYVTPKYSQLATTEEETEPTVEEDPNAEKYKKAYDLLYSMNEGDTIEFVGFNDSDERLFRLVTTTASLENI